MISYARTDTGRSRKMNQDSVFASSAPVGMLPNLFIVADGMGGHKAGDYASRFVVERIVNMANEYHSMDLVMFLRKAIEETNGHLYQESLKNPDFEGMGTTLVLAVIDNETMYVANVGDSRLYVINEEIKQITEDHSLVEEMVRMGGIRREQARSHPKKNIITRAIGAEDELEIDFFQVKLKKGDFVLLCSDGLTNMIEDEEIRMILQGQRDIVEKAEALVATANNNGGKDNIAVILIEPFADEVNK